LAGTNANLEKYFNLQVFTRSQYALDGKEYVCVCVRSCARVCSNKGTHNTRAFFPFSLSAATKNIRTSTENLE